MITVASARERNHSRLRHSSRNLPLKLSVTPFCQGLPGPINAVPMPCATIQDNSALDTNSGLLSLRRNVGAPRAPTSRDSTSMTRAGAMIEHEVVGPHLVRAARRLPSGLRPCNPFLWPVARPLPSFRPPQAKPPGRAHAVAVAPKKDADAAI